MKHTFDKQEPNTGGQKNQKEIDRVYFRFRTGSRSQTSRRFFFFNKKKKEDLFFFKENFRPWKHLNKKRREMNRKCVACLSSAVA